MEQSRVVIRQGSKSDSSNIINLFNRVSSEHKRDLDFWNWVNVKIGDSDSIVVIGELFGKVIANYCILPKTLVIDGSEYRVGMGIHAVVDSSYKNEVSIIDITSYANKLAIDYGIKMLYGFPNKNYHIIQEKIERWNVVSRFDSIVFKHRLYPSGNIKFLIASNVTKDSLSNSLSNVNPKRFKVEIKSTIDYYFERYFNHPQSLYDVYFIEQAGNCRGFVVLKIFQETTGHIVDLFVDKSVDEVSLIKECINNLKVTEMSLWKVNTDFIKALECLDVNFSDGFRTNLLVKFLDKDFETNFKQVILNMNNWSLPMGTSDAF